MHCLASSKQTYPLDTVTLILQLRREALPKTTQLRSGRVEIDSDSRFISLGSAGSHPGSSVNIRSRMASVLTAGFGGGRGIQTVEGS